MGADRRIFSPTKNQRRRKVPLPLPYLNQPVIEEIESADLLTALSMTRFSNKPGTQEITSAGAKLLGMSRPVPGGGKM